MISEKQDVELLLVDIHYINKLLESRRPHKLNDKHQRYTTSILTQIKGKDCSSILKL